MNSYWKRTTVAALIFCASGIARAQGSPSGQGSQSQPAPQASDKPKTPDVTPLTLDELAPNDVTTLAILGQTLPRSLHGNPPDAPQVLSKAEKYSKQAIEIAPTLPKPADMTDGQFEQAKNQSLAMAHSGLGLVFMRRGKYAEAIPELEQAVKIDPTPDPVNYYLLGLANKSASHFDDAVAAFSHCVSMPGTMQATCKSGAEEAKKLGSTQLSSPK